jgi:hypothetical protein
MIGVLAEVAGYVENDREVWRGIALGQAFRKENKNNGKYIFKKYVLTTRDARAIDEIRQTMCLIEKLLEGREVLLRRERVVRGHVPEQHFHRRDFAIREHARECVVRQCVTVTPKRIEKIVRPP